MSEATHEVRLHDPQTLYRHWEGSQWSPWEIVSVDQQQWAELDDPTLVLAGTQISLLEIALSPADPRVRVYHRARGRRSSD